MNHWFSKLQQGWIDFQEKRAIFFLAISGAWFLLIAIAIRFPDTNEFDQDVSHAVQRIQFPGVGSAMSALSFIGSPLSVAILAILIALYFAYSDRRRLGWICFFTLLGLPLNWALKDWINRPRPTVLYVTIVSRSTGMSFPSGHAMGSTVLFGLLAVICWTRFPHLRYRRSLSLALALIPIFVSISRIWLGVHWFSDVTAGIAAGLFCVLALTIWLAADKKV
ncbi:phosphatase PAP2 family protein [soil metagenome]